MNDYNLYCKGGKDVVNSAILLPQPNRALLSDTTRGARFAGSLVSHATDIPHSEVALENL